MSLLAEELGNEQIRAQVDAAREVLEEIDSVQPEEPTPAPSSLRDARYAAVERELIRSFQEAIGPSR